MGSVCHKYTVLCSECMKFIPFSIACAVDIVVGRPFYYLAILFHFVNIFLYIHETSTCSMCGGMSIDSLLAVQALFLSRRLEQFFVIYEKHSIIHLAVDIFLRQMR